MEPQFKAAITESIKRERVITQPHAECVQSMEQLTQEEQKRIQEMYTEWNKIGLCTNAEDPESRVLEFNPHATYLLRGNMQRETGMQQEIVAALHTVGANSPTLRDFFTQFPTYRSVATRCIQEGAGNATMAKHPSIVTCFSITGYHEPETGKGFTVVDSNGERVSAARYLLQHAPISEHATRLAYSRVGRFDQQRASNPQSFMQFYLENLAVLFPQTSGEHNKEQFKQSSNNLAAIAMHEMNGASGALTVGYVIGARPEDVRGGGMNVGAIYPKVAHTAQDQQLIQAVRAQRLERWRTTQETMPYQQYNTQGEPDANGNIVLFTDIPPELIQVQ
ncbi:MAG TPA: hypothetical protein VJB65_00170 [Patescibacteria group bacterium]|nr:hypothetical protein [Patescibacteria group bacterium]